MAVLEALAQWPLSSFIRSSAIAYPLVNAAHIASIALVFGAIATLDLRLLGLFPTSPVGALAPPLTAVAATGVVLAAVTGFLLFSARPLHYVENGPFLVKLALVGAGVLNALLLRRSHDYQSVVGGKSSIRPALRARAALSLLLWGAAIVAGRWIGFSE